jgi:3D (Asp-Asp-Asp) domain-containing protein
MKMKKLLYLLMGAAMFTACNDQQDIVDKIIDDAEKALYAPALEYTLVAADYASISTAANTAAGDDADKRALATAVNTTKSLNSFATADAFVPARLATLYPALRQGSSVNVTYDYTNDRPEYLSRLSAAPSEVLVAENFEGSEYNGSANPYQTWDKNGWSHFVTKGDGSKYWQIRVYSNNKYGQVSANGGVNEETEIYVVSPAINITKSSGNVFLFDVCVGYWNYAGLSVLITEDAKAVTAPAEAAWTPVTENFTIPEAPASGYGVISPAGSMSLDSYVGKTIYIAFKYNGMKGVPDQPTRTTTYQIDNVKVMNGDPNVVPEPGKVYINNEGTWSLYANGVSLTAEDYAAMGLTGLTAAQAPEYLPVWLAGKFPYAKAGEVKAVVYSGGTDDYTCDGAVWAPTVVRETRAGQFVYSDNGWIFDPAVHHTLVTADHKLVIDHMLADPEMAKFASAEFGNEEYYFGFSSRYTNISFRASYRATGGTYPSNEMSSHDTEYHALDGDDAAQAALLWKRLVEKGLPLFASLRWPKATAQSQGVDVLYHITAVIYYPDGVTYQSSSTQYFFTFTYKVVKDGTEGSRAEFEFVSADENVTNNYYPEYKPA